MFSMCPSLFSLFCYSSKLLERRMRSEPAMSIDDKASPSSSMDGNNKEDVH